MTTNQCALLLLLSALSACSPAADSPAETTATEANKQAEGAAGTTIEDNDGQSTVSIHDAEDIIINGNGSVQTAACAGQDIQVLGSDNQATFTGNSKEVYVVGDNNRVSLENVQALEVTGDHNVVSWRGPKPTINNIGQGNQLQQR